MSALTPISDFCKTGSGGTPSRKRDDYYSGDIPWVKSGELRENIIVDTGEKITDIALRESSAKMVPAGSILLAMYGATVGRMAVLGIDAATNQAVCNIRPESTAAFPQYIFHALQAKVPELLSRCVGGAQPNISQQIIKDTKILLPPLPEQKRIAAILDKADAIRRKRREALKMADQFLRSVFLDMFGDPVTNTKGWEKSVLKECIQSIEGGWSANGEARSAKKGEYGVLKISAITSGTFKEEENKAIPFDITGKKLVFPKKGDLLFSRANTRELVAATCIVDQDYDHVFLPDKLWRVQPNIKMLTPEFLKFLLSHHEFRRRLTLRATGTSGSMLNISKAKLIETIVPKPPIHLQRKFSDIYWQSETSSLKRYALSKGTDTLFNSLTQRAFRGEL
jgi:type I restriction enzyme, S subunit